MCQVCSRRSAYLQVITVISDESGSDIDQAPQPFSKLRGLVFTSRSVLLLAWSSASLIIGAVVVTGHLINVGAVFYIFLKLFKGFKVNVGK